MAVSPINNVNNIRNLSFGENKEKPDTEKKSQISTQTKVIVGTSLAALAAVGIYIATRGRTKVKPNTNINKPVQPQQVKLTDEQLIDFNVENKKFLNKVQEKFKTEWEQLKKLEDGKYVKKDNKYVPANENDSNYVEVKHISKGLSYNSVTEFKNGKLKRFITIDDKDLLKSYQSSDGRVVARCVNGEDFVSTNLVKSENDTAFNIAQKYGKRYFNTHYV